MKRRIRMLTLVVHATALLLALAAALVVVGIFNEALDWDLFGPKLEAILTGVFGGSIALASAGVALTVVLGIQEIVRAFRALPKAPGADEADAAPEATRWGYARAMAWILVGFAVLIGALALANGRVLAHRTATFKRIAAEQVGNFEPKLAARVAALGAPPRSAVDKELYDLIRTLDGLTFVERSTLYVPDPEDPAALWGYTAWRDYKTEDGFARFFVAKDFEKALAAALRGDGAGLDRLNAEKNFTAYRTLRGADGKPVGVLRIDGNPRENFREYRLGS